MTPKAVTVFCGSSDQCNPVFLREARELGRQLASRGIEVIYGGGSTGLMGELANGALENNGIVRGVIPNFMKQVEWHHPGLTELILTEDMAQRKHEMRVRASATIALPGGSGTLEELFETITLKRLGKYLGPIVLYDIQDFFRPCIELLEHCVRENFLDRKHTGMWHVARQINELLRHLDHPSAWSEDALEFANLSNRKSSR